MAFDKKDYIIGSLVFAALGAVYVTYHGTQFERVTKTDSARIAGESVELQVYENRWFGGGVNICVDGNTCLSKDAYMTRLEAMVDKAMSDAKSKK